MIDGIRDEHGSVLPVKDEEAAGRYRRRANVHRRSKVLEAARATRSYDRNRNRLGHTPHELQIVP